MYKHYVLHTRVYKLLLNFGLLSFIKSKSLLVAKSFISLQVLPVRVG